VDWLAERFEANLPHVREVAFRMHIVLARVLVSLGANG
jgi:hypothetical protein